MFRIWLLLFNLVAIFCLVQCEYHSSQELEDFKQLFLDSLNLRNEPNMSIVNTSAEEMRRMLNIYYLGEEPLKVFRYKSIAADHSDKELRKNFIFNLPEMSSSDLHSAHLHLSVQPNSTGTLHLLHQNHLVSTLNLNNHQGRKMDFTRTVGQWIEQPNIDHGLTIECSNCQSFPSEAILEVVSRHRKKRQVKNNRSKCKRNHDCCLKKLKINFKDIGWDWIHRPESFDFYFCKGKCRKKTLLSQNALIRSILRSRSVKVPKLCCAPKKTRSLRILHYTDSNPPELVVRKMRGMVVKSCGCL